MTHPSAGSSLNKETPKGKQSRHWSFKSKCCNMEWCSQRPGINSWVCLVIWNERAGREKEEGPDSKEASIEPGVQSLFRPLGDIQGSQWLWCTGETAAGQPRQLSAVLYGDIVPETWLPVMIMQKVRVFISFVKVKLILRLPCGTSDHSFSFSSKVFNIT